MNQQNTRSQLTPRLRYERISPADLKFVDAEPTWTKPAENLDESILSLLDEEWHTDHIKAEMLRLNVKALERSRYALGAQLVSEFVNPERITMCLTALTDDIYQYYLYVILAQNMVNKFTSPTNFNMVFPQYSSHNFARNQILDAGLALRTESGKLYVPKAVLKTLPSSNINFPVAPEPSTYIPAKAPRDFLLQIQQIIGLFDGQTFTLRDRLRWNASNQAYYSHLHCWPPHPEDAKLLLAEFGKTRDISLLPPDPQLSERTLQYWSDHLEISVDSAEFHYHLLVQSALLHSGSPVRINQTLVQKWLALPSNRQIVILYDLYRSLSTWAVWWNAWRKEQVDLKWNYQGYWGLSHVDATLLSMNHKLRGVLLDVLSFLPQGEWLAMDDVIKWIVTVFPNAASHRYIRGVNITGVEDGWNGWLRLVLKQMLGGPLHYFGLADVGPSLDRVEHFRLHNLQDVHWGRVKSLDSDHIVSVESSAFHFDSASRQLQITIPIDPDFLSMIQLWSVPDGQKGKTLFFNLDVECLHQSFEKGNTPSDLCSMWEKITGFDVPEYLQTWWNHWWSSYGHIRLYPPETLLMTRDTFTMKEVHLAISGLSDSIQIMVTPTTAVIKSENVDQVMADLERQGYMPKEVG